MVSDDTAPSDHTMSIAERRFALIRPLIDRGIIPRPEIEAVADAAGVTAATIHRWLSDFSYSGHLSSLVPTTAGGEPGARGRAMECARAAAERIHALLRHPRSNRVSITAGDGTLPVWTKPAEPAEPIDEGALFETPAIPFDDIVPAEFQR